jgi:hypothetical protein
MKTLSELIAEHWFWAAMTAAVVVWYSIVTSYVAFRGVLDIKGMLARLKDGGDEPSADSDQGPKA